MLNTLPALLICMISGSSNDNLVKTAFVVAISTLQWSVFGLDSIFLVNVAAVCFIAPFLIFAAPAARLSQSESPKKALIRLKIIELGLACIASIAIFFEQGSLLLLCVLGFGVQSAFVGPLKYALLPLTQPQDKLLTVNAWMLAGTFIAILLGTIIGAKWIIESAFVLILLILGLAMIGLLSILVIELPKRATTERLCTNLVELIRSQFKDRVALSAMVCISGFWGIGSVWLTHLPFLVTDIWTKDPKSISWFITLFIFGIASGGLFGVLFKVQPIARRVFGGSAIMMIGSILLQSQTFSEIALILTAFGGGFLVLPLYTRLQQQSKRVDERIAANNVLNAFTIVVYAFASMVALNQLNLDLVIWLLILSTFQLSLCVYHRRNLSLS